jgi:hypothetical protein
LAAALALAVHAAPAISQESRQTSLFTPLWSDTIVLAPARLEISAWPFAVVVRTIGLDPGIATFEGDTVVSSWVTRGFDFFDALAEGTPPPAFGWTIPASPDDGSPDHGMRLGLVPDPARGGALTLSFVVFRHAPRRGYVFPVREAEASKILGVLGEAADRARADRESHPPRDPRCLHSGAVGGQGPEYPESFRRIGLGGEVWVMLELNDAGRPTAVTPEILWASHEPLADAVREWLPRARWLWRNGATCAGAVLAPFTFAMRPSSMQRNEGWIWVRRDP